MIVLLNAGANAGRGAAKWARVEPALRARGLAFRVRPTRDLADLDRAVDEALRAGEDAVVAAGGDGTVHAVLNALMDGASGRPRADVALGAVGLGSSNDFHKPFPPAGGHGWVEGVPVRLDAAAARPCDLGKATVRDASSGRDRVEYFVLNASVGIVADGNDFFNGEDPWLLWLKRRHVEAAILYTALVNIARFRPHRLAFRLDGGPEERVLATNLAVLKRVHFTGGMRYDTPVTPDDGQFDVALWEAMSKPALLATLVSLYRGRFRGRPHTRWWRARRVEVAPEGGAAPVEMDGEVNRTERVLFEVVPRAVRVCA